MAALAETPGPPQTANKVASAGTSVAGTIPATMAANPAATQNQAGPSGVTSPSTTAPGPARPPAPPPAAAQSRGAASPRAAGTSRPGRAQTPCVFFAKGSCRNGAHCPFAHVKADDLPDVS